MLKFRMEQNKQKLKNAYDESSITEIAFLIGTNRFIDNVVKEKLIAKVDIDGMVAFCLYVNFMAERFCQSDINDIFEYVEDYFEEDLQDFINKYFEVVDDE